MEEDCFAPTDIGAKQNHPASEVWGLGLSKGGDVERKCLPNNLAFAGVTRLMPILRYLLLSVAKSFLGRSDV